MLFMSECFPYIFLAFRGFLCAFSFNSCCLPLGSHLMLAWELQHACTIQNSGYFFHGFLRRLVRLYCLYVSMMLECLSHSVSSCILWKILPWGQLVFVNRNYPSITKVYAIGYCDRYLYSILVFQYQNRPRAWTSSTLSSNFIETFEYSIYLEIIKLIYIENFIIIVVYSLLLSKFIWF